MNNLNSRYVNVSLIIHDINGLALKNLSPPISIDKMIVLRLRSQWASV
jgi:hypothetical protein